ncbi:unnamed protein product [Oikopleura dioica]|uniref:Uncharacterized protein n=3 Tax=Oikopleura dioica TaxID=34765 RepID=E4XED5_OIKDI|nr:unnamed protein product [Oikopleura dioica]
MASEPWARNMDVLRQSTWMNYSNIDQYWIDQGYNKDNLPYIYPNLLKAVIVISVVMFIGYYVMARSRKSLSLKKQLGEEPLTYWEIFCEGTKLGTEPAINFVGSCLVTNDRVFIIIRIVMALWSLTLTILGWAGARSIIFGSYFPLATIITIYVSRHRHLIVEGFGSKMQFVNKILSYFFCIQAPLRLVLGLAWWTKWFGTSRYKDMRKSSISPRAVLWQQEFLPCIFLIVEILWFDTRMSCISAYHSTITLMVVLVQIMRNCLKENGGTDNPQIVAWVKENPGAAYIQIILHIVMLPACVFLIAGFCNLKIWAFKKIPVIKERVEIRQNCIEIFRKRHALNKFLPKEQLKQRKTNARESYATIGRQTTLRKTRTTEMGNA